MWPTHLHVLSSPHDNFRRTKLCMLFSVALPAPGLVIFTHPCCATGLPISSFPAAIVLFGRLILVCFVSPRPVCIWRHLQLHTVVWRTAGRVTLIRGTCVCRGDLRCGRKHVVQP